jgi:hypothetical protein
VNKVGKMESGYHVKKISTSKRRQEKIVACNKCSKVIKDDGKR